jgi:hypothetical protein
MLDGSAANAAFGASITLSSLDEGFESCPTKCIEKALEIRAFLFKRPFCRRIALLFGKLPLATPNTFPNIFERKWRQR